MRGEFVDLDGVRLYCYAFGHRGAGHPIVLVHGSFTSSHLWQHVLPRLPKGHRVLVLDLLGHGRSDPPRARDGAAGMTVAAHATRLEQLLDVLGVQEAMLVGHGMGAAVAARVAHEQPSRIAHLMLVNPTVLDARADEALLSRPVRRVAALVPLWRRLAPAWLASALHYALLPGFAHRDMGARALDVYLKPFRLREGRDAACAQLTALDCSRGDTEEVLRPGAIQCPTAVVLGTADPFLDRARAARLEASLRTATNHPLSIHRLPGVAHMAPEEAPDRLGTLVGDLLTQ
ncbi:alpha/beta fold hydrolase [Gemmatimonas sp.]|jgi:pimeloyl-ACP methyl ester carboxylesterase|uniref:alpha/beta fold hydrolase n=1 Tax=Gemmatimonas sp. TaxID=1962908 RepID=UPI0037BFBB6B